MSLEEGFALYDPPLEHFELFWEKSLDTKLLLAWNREVILLSFRGTASMSNVFADIQVRASTVSSCRGALWRSDALLGMAATLFPSETQAPAV